MSASVSTSAQDIPIGTRVEVQGKSGTVRFVGTVSFSSGKWYGIELDDATGKNNGVVQGKRYFECRTNHGVMVRGSQVKALEKEKEKEKEKPSTKSTTQGRESPRFAPPQDPNLASAQRQSLLRSPSPSGVISPSRLSTPSSSTSRLVKPSTSGPQRRSLPPSSRNESPTPKQHESPQEEPKRKSLIQTAMETVPAIVDEELPVTENGEDSETEDADVSAPLATETETETETMIAEEAPPMVAETPVQTQTPAIPPATPSASNSTKGQFSLHGPIQLRSEQTVPMKDYEELRLKLKILENKRAEDRERMRESEKAKEEAEQYLTVRSKLQSKLAEMQAELRETKLNLKEAVQEKDSYEIKYTDMAEALEMASLDKEMAEVKAESLQQEIVLMKEKIAEMTTDLSVYKNEGDAISGRARDTEGGEGASTNIGIIQLERQNERLKEALIRLRDATQVTDAELKEKIRGLEKDVALYQDVHAQNERLKNALTVTENQIEDLKERLDDAEKAEEMVEQLSEKNLTLSEKMEEMKVIIEDLEALKELNDELEENHVETEKQLQAEIDHKDMLLREQLERLKSAEETNADYENTITQFRELVTNLQSDMEQLRHREENQSIDSKNLSTQTQAVESLTIQLQTTVMKAQAKAIDLELRKLDALQAADHLACVQPYLPEFFFKSENYSVRCLLLFKRLIFKADLIIKQLDQTYNISEKLASQIPANLLAVCELRQRLGWLADLSRQFEVFITRCSVEVFLKMGQVYHELVGTERKLDSMIETLRNGGLSETESTVDVQRMIAQLEHLGDIYLSNLKPGTFEQYYALTRAIDFNADRMAVDLAYVKQTVNAAAQDDEIKIAEGIETLRYDCLRPLDKLITQSKSSKVMARKVLRRLEDLSKQSHTLKPELFERFKGMYTISMKMGQFCFETFKRVTRYVDERRGSKEEMTIPAIQQTIYNVTEEYLNATEHSIWQGCSKTLESLCQEITQIQNLIADDTKTEKIETAEAPWLRRAADIKAEVVVNLDMERKLQSSSEEILKLMRDIKSKDNLLQESAVKIELLEKRMEQVKKQAEQIAQLEDNLSQSKDREKQYEDAIENLQQETQALEREISNLKLAAKKSEKSGTPKKESADSPATKDSDPLENYQLVTQLESLKAALRYLRAENSHLKSKTVLDNSGFIGLTEQKPKSDSAEIDAGKVAAKSVALETRVLLKDIRAVGASPKVVTITKSDVGKWQTIKKTPDYQYQTQQTVLYTLQQRSNELKAKAQQLAKNTALDIPLKSAQLSAASQHFVAKIRLPQPNQSIPSSGHHHLKLRTAADFEKIHTIFVN